MNKRHPASSHIFFLLLFISVLLHPSAVPADPLVPLHIEKGTNLISIARKFCKKESDWKAIASINHLKPPYIIYNNSTIQIPLSLLVTETVSARVASVNGSPRVITGGLQSRILKKGALVVPGQTIQTQRNEFVHLIYPNNKHTRIGPQSEMTLVYLMRLTDGNLKAEFFLEKGSIIHILKKKLKSNEHFQTRTPVTIAGVRGTKFRVKAVNKETSIVETLTGQVALNGTGKQILLNKGQGSKVKKDQPPTPPHSLPPSPVAPELKQIYRTLPVVLHTPDQTDIQSVRIRVSKDPEGNATVAEQIAIPGQDFKLSYLSDGTYYLFYTATDNEGFESAPTSPVTLKIRTNPAAPILLKPDNGLETFSKRIKIQWLDSHSAKFYKLEIATNPEFTSPILKQQTEDPTFTTPAMDPGTYFFRTQLVTEDGFTTLFSVPLSWKILKQPELKGIDPVSPDTEDITLRWPAMSDVASYTIQIAHDKKFEDMVESAEHLTEPSYKIRNYLASGDHYVRIRSVMKNGLQSPWTPLQTLTIDSEPLELKHLLIAFGCVALILL